MKILSDLYRLHQVVMNGFKVNDDRPRVLYRMEPEINQDRIIVIVQSFVEPSWTVEDTLKAGMTEPRIKTYAPAIKREMALRFRLRANPTVTREGKRYGLIRDEALEGWLIRWEERLGVKFASFNVVDEGYLIGFKGKGRIRIKAARFDGRLVVQDVDAFLSHIESGIGPAKGFGCGLISVALA